MPARRRATAAMGPAIPPPMISAVLVTAAFVMGRSLQIRRSSGRPNVTGGRVSAMPGSLAVAAVAVAVQDGTDRVRGHSDLEQVGVGATRAEELVEDVFVAGRHEDRAGSPGHALPGELIDQFDAALTVEEEIDQRDVRAQLGDQPQCVGHTTGRTDHVAAGPRQHGGDGVYQAIDVVDARTPNRSGGTRPGRVRAAHLWAPWTLDRAQPPVSGVTTTPPGQASGV